jgi:hypothetical protein
MTEPAKKPPLRLQREQVKALRELHHAFCTDLPNPARSGDYHTEKGDGFVDRPLPLPPGTYRVHGSQWLLVVDRGSLVRAFLASPDNEFDRRLRRRRPA